MAKFLRSICGYHDTEIDQAIGRARAVHVLPMYEYYATPLQTDGCGKLNLCFKQEPRSAEPSLVLNVATIEWPFNLKAFAAAPPNAQTRYVLDQAHAAVLAVGSHFGWSLGKAREANDLILENAIRFELVWRKKASPDRKLRVQVEVEYSETVRLYVTYLDQKADILLRKLFSIVGAGPGLGTVAAVAKHVEWTGNSSVKITHANRRDYWICGTDGSVEFYFPRAGNGDAHGLFELGRMYCEGRYVLRDFERGRELLQAAAQKGYQHAVGYLQKLVEPGTEQKGTKPSEGNPGGSGETPIVS